MQSKLQAKGKHSWLKIYVNDPHYSAASDPVI